MTAPPRSSVADLADKVSTTRRSTAAAGSTLETTVPDIVTGAPSVRHLPAQRSLAVQTRVHQFGGRSRCIAPARGRALVRPPPFATGEPA
jgi:hypothetical protein